MPVAIDVQSRGAARTLWNSSIGKKTVMAVTGLIMIAFLLLHMLGNLKIFFGPHDFDNYAGWLRTIGEPVLHGGWYLWIQRAVLVVALGLHITAAAQLTKRDTQSRPVSYSHGLRTKATYPTRTMRTGGIILLLFIIWHLLDLSAGVLNPDFEKGKPYHNITKDFQVWWINIIYIVAMVMLGLHINHGFRSAIQTLGFTQNVSRRRLVEGIGAGLALVISLGFIAVPVAVMGGLVS